MRNLWDSVTQHGAYKSQFSIPVAQSLKVFTEVLTHDKISTEGYKKSHERLLRYGWDHFHHRQVVQRPSKLGPCLDTRVTGKLTLRFLNDLQNVVAWCRKVRSRNPRRKHGNTTYNDSLEASVTTWTSHKPQPTGIQGQVRDTDFCSVY